MQYKKMSTSKTAWYFQWPETKPVHCGPSLLPCAEQKFANCRAKIHGEMWFIYGGSLHVQCNWINTEICVVV